MKRIEVRTIATATVEEVWTVSVPDDFDTSTLDTEVFDEIIADFDERVLDVRNDAVYDERDRAVIEVFTPGLDGCWRAPGADAEDSNLGGHA